MTPLFKIKYSIIDFFRKTETLKLYEKIIKTQFLDQEEIEKIQFLQLKKLIEHAYKTVPFYKKTFDKIGFHPSDFSQLSDLSVLPIISKDTIRANFEDFKSSEFRKFYPRITQTGGTTGKPFITYKDKLSHSYIWANNFRAWNAAGYEPGDKFIHLATGSLLPKTNNLKAHIYNFLQNAILITSYHLSNEKIKKIIKIINSSSAKFLYGYSSAIFLVAQFCNHNNIKINSSLQAIFTTSDMLYPNQRELIEKTFNSVVYDIYGNPESGIISFECPAHDGYHYNQESAYVEILKPNNNGYGKIISTSLYNFAFPLIRYDTGDVGKLSSNKCICGRNLRKISELGGRIRDFIRLKDGRYIHGAFFNHLQVLYDAKWIKQYQIIQEDLNEITLKITKLNEPPKEDLIEIEEALRRGLLPDIKINFDFSGVEYSASGKFRLIISKVSQEWE